MKTESNFIRIVCLFLSVICLHTSCQTIPDQKTYLNSVAVWDLEDYSRTEILYHNLGELLSTKIIDVFNVSGNWTMVERERLNLALEELNIGTGALASDETRLKVGRLMGVRYMVFGSMMTYGDTMQLNLRMVDVETGRIIKTAEKTTDANDIAAWLEVAGAAANDLQRL